MKINHKILIFFVFIVGLFNCEKTVYYHDRTDPEFTYAPNYSNLSQSGATITWSTDEACRSSFYYSFYENKEMPDSMIFDEYRQKQNYSLSNLWPNVRYYCVVKISDFEDNGPVVSDTLLFRTLTNEISSAWDAINANHIQDATTILANFNDVSDRARFTKAWLELRSGNVDEAQTQMHSLFDDYPGFLPNLAGLVVVNHLLLNYDDVILYANKLLAINPTWNFVYTRADLNYKYVRLMMAEAYLNSGMIQYAQDQLDIVFPDNGIDPNLPDTWRVGSTYYENYESALISFINYLYTVL